MSENPESWTQSLASTWKRRIRIRLSWVSASVKWCDDYVNVVLHWLGKSWGMQSQAFESWTTCTICSHEGWMEIFRHALVREGSCPGGCAPSQTKGAPSWTCQKNQANEERALSQYFQRKMWVDCLCPIFSINCGLGKFKSSKLFDLLRSSPTGLTKISV